jgi:hypothetical protein
MGKITIELKKITIKLLNKNLKIFKLNFLIIFTYIQYTNYYIPSMSGATFSNGVRTFLYRVWDENLPTIDILMYFPSTADENKDDTTILNLIINLLYLTILQMKN